MDAGIAASAVVSFLSAGVLGSVCLPFACNALMDEKERRWAQQDLQMEELMRGFLSKNDFEPRSDSDDASERKLARWIEDKRRVEELRELEPVAQPLDGRSRFSCFLALGFCGALLGVAIAEGSSCVIVALLAFISCCVSCLAALCDVRSHCLPWELSAMLFLLGLGQDAALALFSIAHPAYMVLGMVLFFAVIAIANVVGTAVMKREISGAGDWKALPAYSAACAPVSLLALWALVASMLVSLVIHVRSGGKMADRLPFGPHLAVAQALSALVVCASSL